MRIPTFLSFFVTMTAVAPQTAQAQACGDVLTTDTTLTSDLNCPNGPGLTLGANNITLDCDGHSVIGGGSDIGILLDGTHGATVTDCVVSAFNTGFRIDSGIGNRLINNIAQACEGPNGGFQLLNTTMNVVEKNTSLDNVVGRGFLLIGSTHNFIFGNEAKSNGFRGFDLIDSSNNMLFDNFALSNSSAGIIITDSSRRNLLHANVAEQNIREGLIVQSGGIVVSSLQSTDNGTWGILDQSGTIATRNGYVDNTCVGNGLGSSAPAAHICGP